jgi:hypothetical protein
VTNINEGSASALEPDDEVHIVADSVDGNPASISTTQSPSNEPLEVFDEQVALDKWPVAGKEPGMRKKEADRIVN